MDYSLLLGIYNVDEVKRDKIEELKERKSQSDVGGSTDSTVEPVPSTSSQAATGPSTSAAKQGKY